MQAPDDHGAGDTAGEWAEVVLGMSRHAVVLRIAKPRRWALHPLWERALRATGQHKSQPGAAPTRAIPTKAATSKASYPARMTRDDRILTPAQLNTLLSLIHI